VRGLAGALTGRDIPWQALRRKTTTCHQPRVQGENLLCGVPHFALPPPFGATTTSSHSHSLVRQSSAERAAAAEPIWPANEGANDGLSADVPTAPPVFGSTLSTIGAPPTLPPSLKRQTTVDRAKNCESIWDSYKEAIEECDEGQFTECEGLYDRSSYKSKATGEPGPEVMKTIMKEIRKDLPKNIELSVIVFAIPLPLCSTLSDRATLHRPSGERLDVRTV